MIVKMAFMNDKEIARAERLLAPFDKLVKFQFFETHLS